jgi:hypothetical protein
LAAVIALILLALKLLAAPIKSKSRLEAENAVLRHQLIVLRRKVHGRVQLSNADRLFFVQLYCRFPSILKLITIVRPKTLVRRHREEEKDVAYYPFTMDHQGKVDFERGYDRKAEDANERYARFDWRDDKIAEGRLLTWRSENHGTERYRIAEIMTLPRKPL